jgi:hypothetical protein
MPKSFIKDAPTLTVSDVLSLFPSEDTVTVLFRLGCLLTNQLSSIYYINDLPYLELDLSNKISRNLLLRSSMRVQLQAEKRLYSLSFIKMPALVVAFGKMTIRNAKMTFLL